MKTYLIDDDHIGTYLTEQLLRAEGLTDSIHKFLSAEEGLEALLRDLPDALPQLVLLDLNMPLMDGWQFLEALAPYEAQLRDRCTIYILTSSLALTDLEKSRRYPLVAGLVHKPLDRGEIRAMMAELAPDPSVI